MPTLMQVHRQAGLVKRRALVLVEARALGDDHCLWRMCSPVSCRQCTGQSPPFLSKAGVMLGVLVAAQVNWCRHPAALIHALSTGTT